MSAFERVDESVLVINLAAWAVRVPWVIWVPEVTNYISFPSLCFAVLWRDWCPVCEWLIVRLAVIVWVIAVLEPPNGVNRDRQLDVVAHGDAIRTITHSGSSRWLYATSE